MTPRLAALLALCALFAAAWSGDRSRTPSATFETEPTAVTALLEDHAPRTVAVTSTRKEPRSEPRRTWSPARRASRMLLKPLRRVAARAVRDWTQAGVAQASRPEAATASQSERPGPEAEAKTVSAGLVETAAVDPPLPVDVAPGTYRVVNDRGEVRSLVLDRETLDERGVPAVVPARRLYVTATDGVTWYFVRVTERRTVAGLDTDDAGPGSEDEAARALERAVESGLGYVRAYAGASAGRLIRWQSAATGRVGESTRDWLQAVRRLFGERLAEEPGSRTLR